MAKYPFCKQLPLDVIPLAECHLGLRIEFRNISHLEQEALLFGEDTIILDKENYRTGNRDRLRFSVAHEIGHWVLHRSIYAKQKFASIDEWMDFIGSIPPDQYQWIENHADEFAGQLLMPHASLEAAMAEALTDAQREGYIALGKDVVLDFVAKGIRGDFGVSTAAARLRLLRSGLWDRVDFSSLESP